MGGEGGGGGGWGVVLIRFPWSLNTAIEASL